MARKYLDDIGVTERPDTWCNDGDARQERWTEQREIYGFDDREVWSLDYAFYLWLYERLKMYKEIAFVDLAFHKFEYEGEELTQSECIDRMIKGCEVYFKIEDDWNIPEEDQKMINDVTKIWAIVWPVMWW